ncbi:SgcJ/EcaC family oxidoreductase [Dickeya dianthicola]|uniref:SgcJ/EcaC family oxidoreductase n=1 Tax=Dickeya dianthicola TaxID=204039 RepID=UPI0013718F82|nr:SgcJ/EcaC family oxidoreductase [Dickeya dianthicola]MCI4235534.1 SgcJ/EcaC family oxidoreductase [Dickeya dianthicola]MCI4254695.1 SgcJ/EcaC family oxidoreductase [Dickeya dianthicola]MZG22376.1 SgcJ/EcaC family oxidoreductase [Dickeya dianthicola]MZI88252.1 SgcJ/EcaC family oxidoreductase [Dickeya dianthicola]QOL14626.1 SgcJ/EcaC family oxidoreductase [Dickeya dianthicola]
MYKKVLLSLSLLSAAITSQAYAANTETCVKTDEKTIASLFDRWNTSLQTGDAKKVNANYATDAVLLPTLSSKVRKTDAERIDYFEHFLPKKPVGSIDDRVIKIGCNEALDTGNYTFTFGDKSQAKARYTYTYNYDSNSKKWLITSHHSSVQPKD